MAIFHTILVPLDGSLQAEAALPHACNLAGLAHGEVVLVQAVDPLLPADRQITGFEEEVARHRRANEAYLRESAARLNARGVRASSRTTDGFPVAEALVCVAEEVKADLVVMTSHGRSGLPRLLMGSVAEGLARKAPCPVLILGREQATRYAQTAGSELPRRRRLSTP